MFNILPSYILPLRILLTRSLYLSVDSQGLYSRMNSAASRWSRARHASSSSASRTSHSLRNVAAVSWTPPAAATTSGSQSPRTTTCPARRSAVSSHPPPLRRCSAPRLAPSSWRCSSARTTDTPSPSSTLQSVSTR